MLITDLHINHFRSITKARLTTNTRLNLIIGANSSGKTSLLEAIYLLGRGKSFRSNHISHIVQFDQPEFALYTQLGGSAPVSIGIQKSLKQTLIKINGQTVHNASALAYYLPLLLIHPESHYLLEQGPKRRRHFMNWGLFHVEPLFLSLWNEFLITLKQRNALVRKRDRRTIVLWNERLASISDKIHQLREEYVRLIEIHFKKLCLELLGFNDINLVYKKGWGKTHLKDILSDNISRDFELGYTQYGPHRADIAIIHQQHNIRQKISRGEQKLIIIALLLSQALYLLEKLGKKTIILVDDVTAELDNDHISMLFKTLLSLNTQIFVTSVSPQLPELVDLPQTYQMFHVEHGEITASVN